MSSVFNKCSNPSGCCGVPHNIFNRGYQYARTGDGYATAFFLNTIGLNRRNYAQVGLKDSLKAGHLYYAEFYVNLVNRYGYACNNVGLYISKTAPTFNSGQVIAVNPQIISYGNTIITDTLNWIKISGVYMAQGGEQYITIGNFKTDAQTDSLITHNPSSLGVAQYNFDDVSVIPLDSMCLKADAGRDTTIKVGDSVFIGSYTNGIDTIKWYNSNGHVIDSLQPGFWVKPNATGNYRYIVEQVVNGCYSRDTVWVNVALPLTISSYQVAISNEKSVLNKWVTATGVNVSHFNIQRSTNGKDFLTIGKVKANNKSYNEYNFTDKLKTEALEGKTVYYRIVGVDFDGKKTYSVIRNVELAMRNGVSVYPNPAKDEVHIECANAKQLLIIDYLGRTIKQFNNPPQLLTFNCKLLTKGVYLVQIITVSGNMNNIKLLVE